MSVVSQIPLPKGEGLVSSLDRNSADPYGPTALASSTDTTGTSDKRPVLAQHAGQGALFVDHECFTQAWTSCLEPGHSVVKEPVGKPSLSGEPECLSLRKSILLEQVKSGKEAALPPADESCGYPRRISHEGLDARSAGQRLINQWLASLGTARERGQPVAYVFVMGNAIEILRSFGFEMAFPEINSLQSGVRKSAPDFIAKAEDFGFSPDVCSYVKADVGLMLSNMQHPSGVQIPVPDLAIASSLCNVYIKWAEIWERRFGIPAFVLDIPGKRFATWKSPAGSQEHLADARWVEGQFRDLIARCEQITGKKFDSDRLAEVEANVNEMIRLWIEILAFNQARPAPYNSMLDGLTYMGVLNAWRGTPEGVEYMRLLHAEIAGKVARGEGRVPNERFRLVFSGTPCYVNMRRLIELFESHGGVFAASDYLTYAAGGLDSAGLFYDTSRPLESLAEVTTLASQMGLSNHFFSHHALAQQMKDFVADGIVYHGIKSCRTVATSMADNREYVMTKHGMPTLYIESDLIDPRYWSDAQIKNRVDAFFEVLEQRVRLEGR